MEIHTIHQVGDLKVRINELSKMVTFIKDDLSLTASFCELATLENPNQELEKNTRIVTFAREYYEACIGWSLDISKSQLRQLRELIPALKDPEEVPEAIPTIKDLLAEDAKQKNH